MAQGVPPGLELSGLPDFFPLRCVETEARVVQRGVTAYAGSRLRLRFKEMEDVRFDPKKSAKVVRLGAFFFF